MAQKQRQYEGGLDSIFGFIFSGAKRNTKPFVPKNIPGIGGDEMAYSLSEIAMRPAVYASEQVLTPLNEFFNALEVSETKLQLDSKGTQVKVGVNVGNASEFFHDPDAFVDKAFEKAKTAKTLNYIRGFGGVMDLGIGAMLARSGGHSPVASIEMGEILGNEYLTQEKRDLKAEELAARSAVYEASGIGNLDYNRANDLARAFSAVIDSSQMNIDRKASATDREHQLKRVVEKRMKGMGVNPTQDEIDKIFSKYLEKKKKYKQSGEEWNLGVVNKDMKKQNIRETRFEDGPDAWIESTNPADKLRALKYEELKAKANLLPDTDPRKKIFLADLRRLEVWQISNGKNMKWSRFLGEAYENTQVLNMLVLQGGGLSSMLSGDFFDIRKNNLTPAEKKKIKLNGQEFEIVGPRDDMNSVYSRITGLYYLTPGSLSKTLFLNGEYFVYLNYKRQRNIQKTIEGSESLYNYIEGYQGDDFRNILGNIQIQNNQTEVLRALASTEEQYLKLLKILEKNGADVLNDPELEKIFKKLQSLQKKIEGSAMLKYSVILKRFTSNLSPKAWLNFTLRKLFGEESAKKIMSGLFNSQFVLKTYIRRGAKIAIHALMQSLGLATTGGLANGLIWIVTEVGYFIGEKVLKVAVKIGYAFLWIVGVLFLALALNAVNWLGPLNPFNNPVASQFDTAGNTAPIFCEQCSAGSYTSADEASEDWQPGENGGGGGGGGGDQTPPPEMGNVRCPLQPSPLRCSQGPYGGFSHSGNNAIDVPGPPPSYWYAPSDAVVTRSSWAYENSRVPGQLCGGIVHLYSAEHDITYVLVHVVPYVNQNEQVKKGEPIAKMAVAGDGNIHFGNHSGTCATGAHFHLEVRGTSIRADQFYRNQLNCQLGSCP